MLKNDNVIYILTETLKSYLFLKIFYQKNGFLEIYFEWDSKKD